MTFFEKFRMWFNWKFIVLHEVKKIFSTCIPKFYKLAQIIFKLYNFELIIEYSNENISLKVSENLSEKLYPDNFKDIHIFPDILIRISRRCAECHFIYTFGFRKNTISSLKNIDFLEFSRFSLFLLRWFREKLVQKISKVWFFLKSRKCTIKSEIFFENVNSFHFDFQKFVEKYFHQGWFHLI